VQGAHKKGCFSFDHRPDPAAVHDGDQHFWWGATTSWANKIAADAPLTSGVLSSFKMDNGATLLSGKSADMPLTTGLIPPPSTAATTIRAE